MSKSNCLTGNNIIPDWPKKVGGLEVNNPIWLAPLAGISYCSFRKFYKELGTAVVHTEMVSALGLCYKGRKTKELLYGENEQKPVALQLFGSNANDIKRGAELALEIRKFEALEINMACPMPKVTKKGSGSALLAYPDIAAEIISSLKCFGLPVWAKIRRYAKDEDTLKFCETLLNAGADQLFLHGRTQSQRYEGKADREIVRKAASLFPNLISASGDCYTPEDFEEYLDMGCCSVLAARGVLRDLCLIPKTLARLGAQIDEKYSSPSAQTQAELICKLCDAIYDCEGEKHALVMAHRATGAVFKGLRGSAELRREVAFMRDWMQMKQTILDWKEE